MQEKEKFGSVIEALGSRKETHSSTSVARKHITALLQKFIGTTYITCHEKKLSQMGMIFSYNEQRMDT